MRSNLRMIVKIQIASYLAGTWKNRHREERSDLITISLVDLLFEANSALG